ncbi:MAG TPA: serine hydrolase [Candidatus Udaeobacter sp.]|nr:serine hydrolase [Candidatus Udaeobacter sp.]
MNKNTYKNLVISLLLGGLFLYLPLKVKAQIEFNPQFIISDEEMQSTANWTQSDVQRFLQDKGSYLATLVAEDPDGLQKTAAEIIYNTAVKYQINPKFLLVTLQKEQSLVTDDTPTQKQLDWATGYGVCDSCNLNSDSLLKYKGFGKQVDNAAGLIRWYYNNTGSSFVKKKDQNTTIDNQVIIPQSWATAFLYTYTPHIHGNKNFWNIWNTWFSQIYPNGTLLRSASSTEIWLIQNNVKRKFKNQATLLSRADPKMIVTVQDSELSNYQTGQEISFPNFSILKTANNFYLLDYDTLRPFASAEVVRQIGYNPDEFIDITDADIAGYQLGSTITASTTAPQGRIYQITDLNNSYYLFKDNTLYPIIDKSIITVNYKDLKIEKHKAKEIKNLTVADLPLSFKDGTLLRIGDSSNVYVTENNKKRLIADVNTFAALGYKRTNVISVNATTALNIPDGEPIFINGNLISSRNKYLGDSEIKIDDIFGSKIPAYLIAEYPSGRIISGKNIDESRSIASLVKLLVGYEALNQDFDLSKSSVYSKSKDSSQGNNLALKDGAKIKNADLLSAMLIGSTNNTARLIAQSSGLTEKSFIDNINKRLADWGADDTKVIDVTGLDAKNKSTARNLLKIFTRVMDNSDLKSALAKTKYTFKELAGKAGTPSHTITSPNSFSTTNKNYKIVAAKTGSTDEAGIVTAMLIQITKTKKQYTIITMGSTDQKNQEAEKIAKWISSTEVKLTSK